METFIKLVIFKSIFGFVSDASSGQMSPSSSGVSSLGSSWSSPSPTLTPPFPLPPDSPVSALLELSGDFQVEAGGLKTACEETDEGIVSDQSYEYEDTAISTQNKMRTKVSSSTRTVRTPFSIRRSVETFFSVGEQLRLLSR
jgi:hypothetical protein